MGDVTRNRRHFPTGVMSARAFAASAPSTTNATRGRRTGHSVRARRVVARAGNAKDEGGNFMDWLRKEIDITFNPRTPGAKIAGRCPDTQTQPSEVSRDRLSADDEAVLAAAWDFDVRAFAEELERAVSEDGDRGREMAATAAATKSAVMSTEILENEASAVEADEAEDDGFDYYELDGESEGPLTGRELALLCIKKYGKAHDMAIKHVKMGSGMKRWVSLNLYVGHLGQRSYPQTEEAYLEQLDVISYLINSWNQEDYTRAFFREKPIARRGLPSRPRVDTCVTLQFSRSPTWDDELGDEFFDF